MSTAETPGAKQPLLEVNNLGAGYGPRRVLEDVSFVVGPREILAVIGPNGCGKSTLLKAVFGLCDIYCGAVRFDGRDINTMPAFKRPRLGMTYLPQGKHAFEELSVRENLVLGGYTLPGALQEQRLGAVLDDYPQLKAALNRPAYTLSGGERQVLALARALMLEPRLMLLDEPSVGLAPNLAADVLQEIVRIRDRTGAAIVVVEQKVEQVLAIADRAIGLRLGRVACEGSPAEVAVGARSLFLA